MNGEYDWAGYSLPNVDAYVAAIPTTVLVPRG